MKKLNGKSKDLIKIDNLNKTETEQLMDIDRQFSTWAKMARAGSYLAEFCNMCGCTVDEVFPLLAAYTKKFLK